MQLLTGSKLWVSAAGQRGASGRQALQACVGLPKTVGPAHCVLAPGSTVRPLARGSSRCVAAAGSGAGRASAQVEVLTRQLKELEQERDDSVAVAESSAKVCVKLNEMSRLLEELALTKIKDGDEQGAKLVLQERRGLAEIIDKNSGKAQLNYTLAAKLAQKIGNVQNELHALTSPGANRPTSPLAPSSSSSGYAASASSSYSPSSSDYSSTSKSEGGRAGGASPLFSTGYAPQWQKSLLEAQARVQQQGEAATRISRLAEWEAQDAVSQGLGRAQQDIAAARLRLDERGVSSGPAGAEDGIQAAWERMAPGRASAEESVAAAKDRLQPQRTASDATFVAARERVAAGRGESAEKLKEAQSRLRAQDMEIMEYCRRIVARYRAGEYVSDAELEFAFKQLETRLL